MPHIPEDSDPNSWHRYFAMECNNRAWQLAVQSRNHEEDLEMLNAAHASALHWAIMGAELNDMRAKTLLAEVHALLGYGASALQYANEVKPYFLARKTEDWELAYIHVIHAHAAAIAGDSQLHRQSYDAAVPAIDAIADDEDRKIVLQTFEQVPRP
jgi:hypothetical protein